MGWFAVNAQSNYIKAQVLIVEREERSDTVFVLGHRCQSGQVIADTECALKDIFGIDLVEQLVIAIEDLCWAKPY